MAIPARRPSTRVGAVRQVHHALCLPRAARLAAPTDPPPVAPGPRLRHHQPGSRRPGRSRMPLATLAPHHGPRAAPLRGDHYVDLHATDPDLPASVRGLLVAGPDALRRAAALLQRADAVTLPAPPT